MAMCCRHRPTPGATPRTVWPERPMWCVRRSRRNVLTTHSWSPNRPWQSRCLPANRCRSPMVIPRAKPSTSIGLWSTPAVKASGTTVTTLPASWRWTLIASSPNSSAMVARSAAKKTCRTRVRPRLPHGCCNVRSRPRLAAKNRSWFTPNVTPFVWHTKLAAMPTANWLDYGCVWSVTPARMHRWV